MIRLAMLLAVAATASPAAGADYLVRSKDEFKKVSARVQPGDTVRLADGTWRDFRITLSGKGTPDRPITLKAQTPGRVIISGTSDLRLSGEHLVVSGLVFRDGEAPGKELIAFRRSGQDYARNSRVTEIVVDGFNKADRRAEDIWVAMYGTGNRVDHSYFAKKGNSGVTLAVIRPRGESGANRHRIDSNHFGPRPPLGSNGGETIRIGTSDESLGDSATVIENNLFERCDGEVEIISIKSGGNVVRGNTILESQGSIVLRHGNGNIVERNVILARGKANTGGIRVINRDQTVRGNYVEGSRGTSFSSALAVMNGVPNSPINRYHQVANARIENNSFIDVARITLGAGADAERRAPPVGSRMSGNLATGGKSILRVDSDPAGIAFAGNVTTASVPENLRTGWEQRPVNLRRGPNGLLYPEQAGPGAPRDLSVMTAATTGPSWYVRSKAAGGLGSGRTALVPSGSGGLEQAVARSAPGDVLRLGSGSHRVERTISVLHPLTIRGDGKATLRFSSPVLFQIGGSGDLRMESLAIVGEGSPGQPAQAVVRGPSRSSVRNYAVELDRVRVEGSGQPLEVVATTKDTLADRITIRDSDFANLSGPVIAAAAETDEKGYYGAEHILVERSRFREVASIVTALRGGTDESTFGPSFAFRGSDVNGGGAIALTGVQDVVIEDNVFTRSPGITVTSTVGSPIVRITRNRFVRTPAPKLASQSATVTPQLAVVGNRMESAQ